MTDKEEQFYENGHREAWRSMLGKCIRELHPEDTTKEFDIAHLEDVRAALRSLCAVFGDNDWDDDLHLADVLSKHLANHLHHNFKAFIEQTESLNLDSVLPKLKRFDMYITFDSIRTDEDKTGEWVRFEDVEKLLNELKSKP